MQPTNQTNPTLWQVVIHREISSLDFLWPYVEKHTDAYLANQHDADAEINRTHVHIMLRNFKVTKQAFTKFLNGHDITGSDNFGILTVYKEKGKSPQPYDEIKLGIYIIKSNTTYIRNFHYNPALIAEWASKWLDHKTLPKPIDKLVKQATHWDLIQEIIKQSQSIPNAWKPVIKRDQDGSPTTVYGLTHEGRVKIYDLMIDTLNQNKVRTSSNELERFYVTIIRHDYFSALSLRDTLLKKLFRDD